MNEGSQFASLLLLLLPLLLIGFMLWSSRRRQKAMAEFSASLEVGDEIFLTSGILGTILELDSERARVQVAEGTVLTVDRRAIGMKTDSDAARTGTSDSNEQA